MEKQQGDMVVSLAMADSIRSACRYRQIVNCKPRGRLKKKLLAKFM